MSERTRRRSPLAPVHSGCSWVSVLLLLGILLATADDDEDVRYLRGICPNQRYRLSARRKYAAHTDTPAPFKGSIDLKATFGRAATLATTTADPAPPSPTAATATITAAVACARRRHHHHHHHHHHLHLPRSAFVDARDRWPDAGHYHLQHDRPRGQRCAGEQIRALLEYRLPR